MAYTVLSMAICLLLLTQIGKKYDSPQARTDTYKIIGFLLIFGTVMLGIHFSKGNANAKSQRTPPTNNK